MWRPQQNPSLPLGVLGALGALRALGVLRVLRALSKPSLNFKFQRLTEI